MSDPTTDKNLAADEARRAVQHDSVKAQVEGDVNSEIADRAAQAPAPAQARKIDQVAGTFREHAVDEVIDSERNAQRSRGVARLSQFIDYGFFLIYALLATRFLLSRIAAKSSAGFVTFITTLSNPFYAPFRGIVDSPRTGAGNTVLLPMIVALVAYSVLHLAINRLLRLISVRKTEI
jgi:uncharacterized protein YggT (Ycf19 family)